MIPYLILRVTAFDFASGLIPGNIEHCTLRRSEPIGLASPNPTTVVCYSYSNFDPASCLPLCSAPPALRPRSPLPPAVSLAYIVSAPRRGRLPRAPLVLERRRAFWPCPHARPLPLYTSRGLRTLPPFASRACVLPSDDDARAAGRVVLHGSSLRRHLFVRCLQRNVDLSRRVDGR